MWWPPNCPNCTRTCSSRSAWPPCPQTLARRLPGTGPPVMTLRRDSSVRYRGLRRRSSCRATWTLDLRHPSSSTRCAPSCRIWPGLCRARPTGRLGGADGIALRGLRRADEQRRRSRRWVGRPGHRPAARNGRARGDRDRGPLFAALSVTLVTRIWESSEGSPRSRSGSLRTPLSCGRQRSFRRDVLRNRRGWACRSSRARVPGQEQLAVLACPVLERRGCVAVRGCVSGSRASCAAGLSCPVD